MDVESRSILNVQCSVPSVLILGFGRIISVGSSSIQGHCARNDDAKAQCLTLPRSFTFWPCWHPAICST